MARAMQVPDVAQTWVTEEILELLRAVKGPHVDKKRYTLIKLAVARVTPGVTEESVWQDEDSEVQAQLCARSTWYGKWKHQDDIKAAMEACEARLRDWRDMQTLQMEADYLNAMRQAIAAGGVDAVTGLRRTALSQIDKAEARNEASKLLIALASEEHAERINKLSGGGQGLKVEVTNLENAVESELARVADVGEVADAGVSEELTD